MQFLRDRPFFLIKWVGNSEGVILNFTTYTYDKMYGGGNLNIFPNIKYEADLVSLFWIFFCIKI